MQNIMYNLYSDYLNLNDIILVHSVNTFVHSVKYLLLLIFALKKINVGLLLVSKSSFCI